MVQAEIDRIVLQQRIRDRQREMNACRGTLAMEPTSPSRVGIVARMQSLARHLRAGHSVAGTAS